MLKKGSKKGKKQISKCDTCFFLHFASAFQKYSFKICSFSHKKVVGYFRVFFTDCTFFRPVPFPINQKKNFYKKTFKVLFIKSQKVSR